MNATPARKGFTLVELLVVTGLMASLLSLVIVAMRPNEDAHVKQASQILVSTVMQTQTMGLSSSEGAAFLLKSSTSTKSGTAVTAATPQPRILAMVTSGMPPTNPASSDAAITVAAPSNADDVFGGYRIRFGTGTSATTGPSAYSPWFGFEPTASTAGIVKFLPSLSQAPSNTVWPFAASPAVLLCEIARRPIETQSNTLFPKMAAVDMRYSGVGDDPVAPCGTFENFDGVAFHFGRTGSVETLIPLISDIKVATDLKNDAVSPCTPIYILVAPLSNVNADTSLRTDRSIWIAISPTTGRAITGKNTPQASPPPTLASSDNSKENFQRDYREYMSISRQQVRRQ